MTQTQAPAIKPRKQIEGFPEIFLSDDIEPKAKDQPVYNVSDVSSFFLGRPAHWLRWQERMGHLNDPYKSRKTVLGKGKPGELRSYTLRDVEVMIWQLHTIGSISDSLRDVALRGVEQQRDLYLSRFENPYLVKGVPYDLSVEAVAILAERSPAWVRAHAEALGGIRKAWNEGNTQMSWMFSAAKLDERIESVKEQSAANQFKRGKKDEK